MLVEGEHLLCSCIYSPEMTCHNCNVPCNAYVERQTKISLLTLILAFPSFQMLQFASLMFYLSPEIINNALHSSDVFCPET